MMFRASHVQPWPRSSDRPPGSNRFEAFDAIGEPDGVWQDGRVNRARGRSRLDSGSRSPSGHRGPPTAVRDLRDGSRGRERRGFRGAGARRRRPGVSRACSGSAPPASRMADANGPSAGWIPRRRASAYRSPPNRQMGSREMPPAPSACAWRPRVSRSRPASNGGAAPVPGRNGLIPLGGGFMDSASPGR